jgi:hypothetical protein
MALTGGAICPFLTCFTDHSCSVQAKARVAGLGVQARLWYVLNIVFQVDFVCISLSHFLDAGNPFDLLILQSRFPEVLEMLSWPYVTNMVILSLVEYTSLWLWPGRKLAHQEIHIWENTGIFHPPVKLTSVTKNSIINEWISYTLS